MGAFIPGMDEHNAVNNSDGFSTGFLGNKTSANFNPVPPQGYMSNNSMNNIQNTQNMPMGNFQSIEDAITQKQPLSGADQVQIVNKEEEKPKLVMPAFPTNNNQLNSNPIGSNNSPMLNANTMNNTNQIPVNAINNTSQIPVNNINQEISNNRQVPDNQLSTNNTVNLPINIVPKQAEKEKKSPEQIPNSFPINNRASSPIPDKKEDKQKEERNKNSVMNKVEEMIKKDKTGAKEVVDKNKNNSKVIHIAAISIIVVLVAFITLIATGVIKFNKKSTATVKDPVVDKEKEHIEEILTMLNNGCVNLSANGTYGEDTIKDNSECDNLVCFINNNVICQNSICMVAVEDKVYTRVCKTGESRSANKNDFQANLNLEMLCEILTNSLELNGNFKDDFGSCSNYQCTTLVEGKEYSSTCQKNG